MSARLLRADPEGIRFAAESLQSGGIGGMPTETVYGLAGAALNPSALTRIFGAKERPAFDPLIVHLPASLREGGLEALRHAGLVDTSTLSFLARRRVETLIQAFWPGPLTLVLPKQASVPDLATSGLPTVALRIPKHPIAQALLSQAGLPLAAPSANRFGRVSPTTPQHVLEELGDRIDWVLDADPCEVGIESTVISIDAEGVPRLLRPGGLAREAIESAIGASLELPTAAPSPQAPGMLLSHYAPSRPLFLLRGALNEAVANDPGFQKALSNHPKKIGLLLLSGDPTLASLQLSRATQAAILARTLSKCGDLDEAARNLFSTLRELDASGAEVLIAEPCLIDQGIGYAIADRLRRAAAARS